MTEEIKAIRYLNEGAYVSSTDIQDRETFDRVVAAAAKQRITCRWDWNQFNDYGGICRLVVRPMGEILMQLDVEASPFADRTRYSVDEWCNNTKQIINNDDCMSLLLEFNHSYDKKITNVVAYKVQNEILYITLSSGKLKLVPLYNLVCMTVQ